MDKARLEELSPHVDDAENLRAASATLLRFHTTEFEYKAARHLLRGRDKKAQITERASEFAAASQHDWRVQAHPALVAELERIVG